MQEICLCSAREVEYSARSLKRLGLALALICQLFLVGCGSGKPATYPVPGSIKFEDGSPVTFGIVEFFHPELELSARGKIQPDGTFRISTFEPGDGAVAGKHRVMIIQLLMPGTLGGQQPPHQGHIDSSYANFETSQLEFTVDPNQENRYDVTVRKDAKRHAVSKPSR